MKTMMRCVLPVTAFCVLLGHPPPMEASRQNGEILIVGDESVDRRHEKIMGPPCR